MARPHYNRVRDRGCGSDLQFGVGHPAARSAECGRRERKSNRSDRREGVDVAGFMQTEFGVWDSGGVMC